MSNGNKTNFYYLATEVICILKPVDQKVILPRVITLPHFPLHVCMYVCMYVCVYVYMYMLVYVCVYIYTYIIYPFYKQYIAISLF